MQSNWFSSHTYEEQAHKVINHKNISFIRETATIPKAEYEYLKAHAKDVDWELVEQFRQGLQELKDNKFIEC